MGWIRLSLAAMNPMGRLAIFTGLLSVYLCAPSLVSAQTVPEPSFEVVSIRPSGPGAHSWSYKESPDRVALTGANARTLVADAYGKDLPNILGGPAWINSEQYDVNATFGDSVAVRLASLSPKDRMDQIFLMLRSAMEQRFGLRTHHETREVPVYALVLAKGGPKFGPAPPAANEAGAREVGAKYNGHLWTVNREPMSFLALQLSRIPEVGRNVIDQTGLKGDYRFNLDWSSKTDPDVSVFTVVKEQLGLTLEPTKSPVDFLVIDHIELPSEN
jgi:bla regulator protein BlaR1